MSDAIAAAKAAEAVVFVIGGDWWIEHEGMDRTNITLPGDQAALITQVREAVGSGIPSKYTNTLQLLVMCRERDLIFEPSFAHPAMPKRLGLMLQ